MACTTIATLVLLIATEDVRCANTLGASGFRYSGSARAAAFNAKSNLLSIVTSRGELLRFDATTGAVRERRGLISGRPATAAFSGDGLVLAIAQDNGTLIIESADGKRTTHALGTEYGPFGMAVTNAGGVPRVVAIGQTQNGATPVIFSGPGFANRKELYLFVRPAHHVEFSPDGSRLLFAGPGGVVVIGRKPVEQWEWKGEAKACFADDSRVAIVDRDRLLNVWDYARDLWPREAHQKRFFSNVVASGHPGRLIASASGGKLRRSYPLLLDANDFKTVLSIEDESFSLGPSLLLAEPGVIANFAEGCVRRASGKSGKNLEAPTEALSPVYAIDVAADGTIGAGYGDGTFRLFRPPEFRPTVAKESQVMRPVSSVHAGDGRSWIVGRSKAALPQSKGDQADVFNEADGSWTPVPFDDGNFSVQSAGNRSAVLLQIYGFKGRPSHGSPIRRFEIRSRKIQEIPCSLSGSYLPFAQDRVGGVFAAAFHTQPRLGRHTAADIKFFGPLGDELGTSKTEKGEVVGMAFRGDGEALVVCQGVVRQPAATLGATNSDDVGSIEDALVAIHDASGGGVRSSFRIGGEPKWAAFGEVGRWLAVGFDDRVEVINTFAAPKSVALIRTDYVPTCGSWIKPGQSLAIGGDDTRIRIYDIPKAK